MDTKKLFLILVGVLQIIGGVFLFYTLYRHSENPEYNLFLSILTVSPFALFSIYAGTRILISRQRKAIIYSLVNYLLQLFQIRILGAYYFYATGPFIGIGFYKKVNENIEFWWDKSEFIFYLILNILPQKNELFISVNIVSLFILLILFYIYIFHRGKY